MASCCESEQVGTLLAEPLEALAAEINAEHERCERVLKAGLKHAVKVGLLLLEAKDQIPHGDWGAWVEENVQFSRRTAQAYMRVAERLPELEEAQSVAHLSFGDALKLLAKPHVAHNSGESEWYTPGKYIDAARAVMDGVDLDPASSETAQQTVRATTYYTAATDGLAHDWEGSVWLNPPYDAVLVRRYIDKLCASIEAGSVTAAIVLVNNATETAWFQRLARLASAICFPSGRIRFLGPDGEPKRTPLQGQAVLYVGDEPADFRARFEPMGFIVEGSP
jgi:ParB family chromosome partitioning protein